MVKKIAILGDFNPAYYTHHALNDSTRQIKNRIDHEIQFDWIATDVFDFSTAFKDMYSGLWIAPGSPYKDMDNVLNTIRFTRENNIPTFGNCGGFQHMIIEFARNVCGINRADHEETNSAGEELLIVKSSCSLKGEQEDLEIVDKESLLYKTFRVDKILGKYFCSYVVNEKYIGLLRSKDILFTAVSATGEFRAFEIKTHPFFLGTLFQPALTSSEEEPNPIIVEFVRRSIQK